MPVVRRLKQAGAIPEEPNTQERANRQHFGVKHAILS